MDLLTPTPLGFGNRYFLLLRHDDPRRQASLRLTISAFLVLGHGRRQLLWFAVTRHPTAE
jgi:hypothetical protein